jgi:hypothetical protein
MQCHNLPSLMFCDVFIERVDFPDLRRNTITSQKVLAKRRLGIRTCQFYPISCLYLVWPALLRLWHVVIGTVPRVVLDFTSIIIGVGPCEL